MRPRPPAGDRRRATWGGSSLWRKGASVVSTVRSVLDVLITPLESWTNISWSICGSKQIISHGCFVNGYSNLIYLETSVTVRSFVKTQKRG